MSDLRDLAKRCEAALGPDRLLDAALYPLRKPWPDEDVTVYASANNGTRTRVWRNSPFSRWIAPRYTASIDAALTLVPPILARHLFLETSLPSKAGYRRNEKELFYFEAATPALAVCAAAVRAHLAVETEMPDASTPRPPAATGAAGGALIDEDAFQAAWLALRKRCCGTKPAADAKRVVMMGEGDLRAAIRAYVEADAESSNALSTTI